MLTITGLNCIYDTSARGWAMEISFADETATRRFDLDSADDAEMLIEAFEDSVTASFDPESGEIRFAFEYATLDEEGEQEDESDEEDVAEDESEEDEDGDDEGDDKKAKRKAA